MPLYAYQCTECGVRFERHQHFTDAPLTECPECGGELRRLIGPVRVVFKGNGFYVNDRRGKNSSASSGD